MADLDVFLASLKKYVSTRSDLTSVIATGWHVWCWPYQFLHHFVTAFDPSAQAKIVDLYTGKTKWTDLGKNPYVPAFAKLKEWYDLGYFPKSFWTLAWEDDFEAAFIGRKAILTFHGPWLWDKVEAADPSANLSGFPLPANSAGKIQAFPPDITQGPGIYQDVSKNPDMLKAAVRALNFYLSPEGVKMLSESLGAAPAYDLSSVGGANLKATQYLSVIKPVLDGKFGKATWDMTAFGTYAGSPYYIEGRPSPVFSDPLNAMWGDFFSGKTDMAGFMAAYQQMFDNAYKLK
jgi:ABC-type glycerol-3-phosphate transport system substrate-binding protein